jgi:aspartate/methionine/tyrosine aminotransferase
MTIAPTFEVPLRFPPASMSALVDRPMRYDLAESTCPALRLGDLLRPDVVARLARLETGYGTTPGDETLRGLLAAGLGVTADQVLLTAGASSALALVALAVCEPGDQVVIATPCFPPARGLLDTLRLQVTGLPLAFDQGYRLDVDALVAALTPRTRLVSLASPQNPSGVRFGDRELRAVVEALDRHAPDAVLLVDETYREATYGDAAVPASVAALSERVVTCASLSKSHGAPGLRTGWLTSISPVLYEALRRAKFTVLVSGSGVDEMLAAEVLRQADGILAGRRALLAGTLATLQAWAAEQPGLEFLRPDGGALCCLRLHPGRYDDDAVRRFHAALAEREVRVAPGSWFGESDRVFRVGFGHLPPELFERALDRVGAALARL